MSEMIERVTDGILRSEGISSATPMRNHYRSIARAAIEAMREPTDEMMMEAIQIPGIDDQDGLKAAWRKAIDEALK
jgi:hypothetical protein